MEWENEFRKHLVNKLNRHFKSMYGEDAPEISSENIVMLHIPLDFDYDINDLPSPNLANMYISAIMQENFEAANNIKEILTNRGCKVDLTVDDVKKEGLLQITLPENEDSELIEYHLKVLNDGLCIDFDKDEF